MIDDFIFSLHQLHGMITYKACPGCGQPDIYKVLVAKDYTVSHELFEIWHCNNCTLRFTQNAPEQNDISGYYQSENYISHSDTNKGLVNKLYHVIRKRTVIQKKHLIEKISGKKNGSLLDVGAGTGSFLSVMKDAGWAVTGVEPDASARAKAKELYDIQLTDAHDFFLFAEKSFDVITLWHVIEHVHELHKYVKHLKGLLKPGGKLFIAVPNYTSFDAKFYGQYWAAYDVPRHLYHFSPVAMEKLLGMYEMKIIALKPMWFDSFYVSTLSEKYKSGESNLLKAFINGFRSNAAAVRDTKKCSSLIYIISS